MLRALPPSDIHPGPVPRDTTPLTSPLLSFPPTAFALPGSGAPPSRARSRNRCKMCMPRLQTWQLQRPKARKGSEWRTSEDRVEVDGGASGGCGAAQPRRLLAGLPSPSPSALRLTAIDNFGPPSPPSSPAPPAAAAAADAGEKLRTGANPARRAGSGVPLASRGEPDGSGTDRIGMSANTGWTPLPAPAAAEPEPDPEGVAERPLRVEWPGATTALPLPLTFFSICGTPPSVLSWTGAELRRVA